MLEYLKKQDEIKKLLIEALNPAFYNCLMPDVQKVVEWHQKTFKGTLQSTTIEIKDYIPSLPVMQFITLKLKKLLWPTRVGIIGAYVHGSFANDDYVEGSDLDLIYVLSDCVAQEYDKFLSLREALIETMPLFFMIDPLQHHGPYILTERMFHYYLESYLPIDVWKESKRIFGKPKLEFNVVKSPYHDKLWFEKSREYYNGEIKLDSVYDRKRFVSMATMIPAVTYPYVTGKYTTKAKAIEWFREKYPDSAVMLCELEIRRNENAYNDVDDLLKEVRKVLALI